MFKSLSVFLHNIICLKKLLSILILLIFAFGAEAQREFQVSGVVMDEDSITVIPFVFAINKRTGNGQPTDFNGKFILKGIPSDTLTFSYLGYNKKSIAIKDIKNVNDSTKQFLRIVLRRQVYSLAAVNVNTFKIKPYEREYMQRVINQPKVSGVYAIESPITALYNQFSHKGRANRKLQALFEQMFIDEQVEQKFNADVMRKLTGDEELDFQAFKKYCYSLTDSFILTHEGYDLYKPIMDCYKRWKADGH